MMTVIRISGWHGISYPDMTNETKMTRLPMGKTASNKRFLNIY